MSTQPTTEANDIDLTTTLHKPYYHVHFFVCVNRRNNSRSCAGGGSEHLQEYAKKRAKELERPELGRVRINKSGCLGRCEHGPIAVVYPDGVWYRYRSKEDLNEILLEHIVHGRTVHRLVVRYTEDME